MNYGATRRQGGADYAAFRRHGRPRGAKRLLHALAAAQWVGGVGLRAEKWAYPLPNIPTTMAYFLLPCSGADSRREYSPTLQARMEGGSGIVGCHVAVHDEYASQHADGTVSDPLGFGHVLGGGSAPPRVESAHECESEDDPFGHGMLGFGGAPEATAAAVELAGAPPSP